VDPTRCKRSSLCLAFALTNWTPMYMYVCMMMNDSACDGRADESWRNQEVPGSGTKSFCSKEFFVVGMHSPSLIIYKQWNYLIFYK
jgi:hypothetical protein